MYFIPRISLKSQLYFPPSIYFGGGGKCPIGFGGRAPVGRGGNPPVAPGGKVPGLGGNPLAPGLGGNPDACCCCCGVFIPIPINPGGALSMTDLRGIVFAGPGPPEAPEPGAPGGVGSEPDGGGGPATEFLDWKLEAAANLFTAGPWL